jgi:hypothetical protein
LLSVDWEWRLLLPQIEKNPFFSLYWSFCAFSLLLARISSAVAHSTSVPLCLGRIRFWDLNPRLGWSFDIMSMSERCFNAFRLSQRRGYGASTTQRRFTSYTVKLKLACWKTSCAIWNPSSILKGKNVHRLVDVESNFSLGTSESEADERYLLMNQNKIRRKILRETLYNLYG